MSSSLPFLLGSRETVYKSLVNIRTENVKCYAWFTFLSLKISMFWKSCNDPKHLFSNSNLFPPLSSLNSGIPKKWTYKAELVTFEVQLLDAIEVQGIALHLDEFQVQYYLRNNLSVQLYGNYRKSDYHHHDNTKHHQYSGNRNPILLLDERLTTQHLIGDTGKQHILITLFLCQQNKEKFSNLSLRLRSKSTILHQIISIEVLELKTYHQSR